MPWLVDLELELRLRLVLVGGMRREDDITLQHETLFSGTKENKKRKAGLGIIASTRATSNQNVIC